MSSRCVSPGFGRHGVIPEKCLAADASRVLGLTVQSPKNLRHHGAILQGF